MNDLLTELQQRYFIKNFPYHIECIDISHLSGGRTSGGLSCFLGGVPYKYGYRRYKITGHPELISESQKKEKQAATKKNTTWHPKSDDYAALQEVILRRFKTTRHAELISESQKETNTSHAMEQSKDNIPDLFILDWWKWQLAIIAKIRTEFLQQKQSDHRTKVFQNTTFISLGKWAARKRSAKNKGEQEEIFYFDQNYHIHSKKLVYDQIDRILTHIRDEAHRFANAYRKKQISAERKN